VIPDGDRRHHPESGGVVDEIATLEWDENVVRVLVLRENGLYVRDWTLCPAPIQHVPERRLRGDNRREARARSLVEARVVNQRCVTHTSLESVGAPNGSRLSCGALKKDSLHNLRAPPASGAC